jgi:RNA polymerase sigma-70 factor (ECF subfamily)
MVMTTSPDLAALFDEYYPKLYAYVRGQVTDRQTAEDITAATFERAFSRSHTYDPAKGAFSTWLFQIARNLVIDHYNAAGRKPPHFPLEETKAGLVASSELSPESHLLRQEECQLLLETLAALSERDREIIHLRFFGQLTNRKIAEIMDLNEKTVSVIIFRALQKLKVQIVDQEAT